MKLPETVKELRENAFEDCTALIGIHIPEGSKAEAYARENGIPCVLVPQNDPANKNEQNEP